MGKTAKQRIGDLGEEIASAFLVNKGLRLVGRNVRSRAGEIDIVFESDDNRLVFVEVKTVELPIGKQALDYDPIDKLSPRKIARLERTILYYLEEHKIDMRWQLDAVVVYLDTTAHNARCRHYSHISRD